MTNLQNNLSESTTERVNRLFKIESIILENDVVIIKSENAMTCDWAFYIANELNVNFLCVEYKTNY